MKNKTTIRTLCLTYAETVGRILDENFVEIVWITGKSHRGAADRSGRPFQGAGGSTRTGTRTFRLR